MAQIRHPKVGAQVYMGWPGPGITVCTLNPDLLSEVVATNRYHALQGWPHKYVREYIDQWGDVAAYIGTNTLDAGAEVVSR